jgi:UDP-N-acetylmuramoylalanine--D-glutamate ligase
MAIKALKNVDTIFLGGKDRGYNFSQLEKTIKQYKISNVVLFPDSGKKIELKGQRILKTRSMEDAVKFAYKNTPPGKICLLSSASPSYSLWKNFEEKGNQFKKFVKKLSK